MIRADEYLLMVGLIETHDIIFCFNSHAQAMEKAADIDIIDYLSSGWPLSHFFPWGPC